MAQARCMTFLGCMIFLSALPACHDARYDAARQRRDDSVEKVARSWERQEAQRDARVLKTLDHIEDVEADRPQKLEAMNRKIEKELHEREMKRRELQPFWNMRLRKLFQGDPQGADEAFAKMY
ncbi:MAG: hypothetical protein KJ057_16125 [Phycisphaerae bacterium]|nr:MAG: hypothetical protein F9K17_09720 [Phycisphaerae bacterium]MBE7456929.1 hypothetical protein [Planctomycetia bacterium]MCK6466250.1 hypothetical protein [Phycisphaerae bacterium]MCL4719999.1 hypothetical protein [Phycisphaerae bacterium]NUQ09969.1 hypothetical protein [Phycisphaerae bacterium]